MLNIKIIALVNVDVYHGFKEKLKDIELIYFYFSH